MTNSTPEQASAEQDRTNEEQPETQVPTPTPASGTDAGEFTQGTAQTPEQADSPEEADDAEVPDTEELQEPSTEKEPAEEPKAPARDEDDPDHQAVGIGLVDGPQTDTDDAAAQ